MLPESEAADKISRFCFFKGAGSGDPELFVLLFAYPDNGVSSCPNMQKDRKRRK